MWKLASLFSSYVTLALRSPTTIGRDFYHIATEMPRRRETMGVGLCEDGTWFRDFDPLNDHLHRNTWA